MNYKLSDLKGADPDHVAWLLQSGIENTNELMNLWNDPPRMSGVAASMGVPLSRLTRLVSMARMARMKGVGPRYVGLLVSAGVIGRRSLSKHTPESLADHLTAVNTTMRLQERVPTLLEIGAWFAELKPLPGMVP